MLNQSCAIILNGCLTNIVLKEYNNRILLIVTQSRKLGSLIAVNHETLVNDFSTKIYSTKTLFGVESTEVLAAARYIAEQINIEKSLLVTLCLKQFDTSVLAAITTAVNHMKLVKIVK